MFFKRKPKLINQIQLKEDLIKNLNSVIYKLEKGDYNKDLNAENVNGAVEDLKKLQRKLDNSVGTGETDISLGCEKVNADLKEVIRVSKDNLDGRFEDAILNLSSDLEEIIDYEGGLISDISQQEDSETKAQKMFLKKLGELVDIESLFTANKTRVEKEIEKLERDKAELDKKFLSEPNMRKKQDIFRSIKSNQQKTATLQVKATQYSGCYNLLDSIKIYANELIASGQISTDELDRAKVILNINRLKDVLDSPEKLKPLLKQIKDDLNKAQENIKTLDKQINDTLQIDGEINDEMSKYMNDLIDSQAQKESVQSEIEGMENYMNQLKKDENKSDENKREE